MTRQADFKRRVRARMAKTGESYATARAQLLAEHGSHGASAMRGALHVTNGDSAAGTLRQTSLAERVLLAGRASRRTRPGRFRRRAAESARGVPGRGLPDGR